MNPAPAILRSSFAASLALALVLSPGSAAALGTSGAHGSAASEGDAEGDSEGSTVAGDWLWPVSGARAVLEPFRAPAHAYGAGHRGMDVAASYGAEVRSPADGIVAFRGVVVDRPLLTIDHGGGYVSTFEPVDSTLSPGDVVLAGQPIGTVSRGGHTAMEGGLHVGVRLNGAYVNPLPLFGDVPRAVLLPCCDTG